jgi:4-hydroxybenzoate polyprenyltransferase
MTTTSNLARTARRAWNWILAIDRFVRLYLVFFTATCVLLGAASIPHDLTIGQLSALLGVTLCFHIYTYTFNDVVDLSIDRINPARRQDLLVRGALTPGQVLLIAFVQPLLAILLTASLGAGAAAYVTLAAAFVLMGAYNVWGKRYRFPPLTDAIQGLAWGSLTIYAAQAIGAAPTALTWIVAAYLTVFTLLFNGIYGPFRDLASDFAAGAKTTAIVFGARPASAGRGRYVPRILSAYAWCILVILVGMNAVLITRNDFHYSTLVWIATACIVSALNVWAVLLQPEVLHPRESAADVAWRLQMYILISVVPIAFFAHAGTGILVALAFLNAFALVLFDCTSAVTRWLWGIIGAVRHLVHEEHRAPARITHAD